MTGVPFTFATATTAIPLSELDVCFATPVTIGSTTVALGNSVPSLAGLTSVGTGNLVVGGGDTITVFDSGTFTPTDQSGAGLSLTVARSVFTQIGTRVWVELSLVYPTTADNRNALIGLGALPACANVAGVGGMWPVYWGQTTYLQGFLTPGTSNFALFPAAGTPALRNVDFSTITLRMQFSYSTV